MAEQFYGKALSVKVSHGVLKIEIGTDVLAHAVSYADWANTFNEEANDYIRTFAIEDPVQFAKDVCHAMLDEREDGSTPLSDFIDKMSQAAVDEGSLGLNEDFEQHIKHGETAECETWARRQLKARES